MHSTLLAMIFSFFVLTTFVHSAPTASLDSATLLNNALEAQNLNAQFQTANGAVTGSCNNGDTTCFQGAIASCVNGQFDTSQGLCPANQQCFALPSVDSNGTTITCTSEKIALSLIEAAGATGGITGSGSGGSSTSPSSTSSGGTSTATSLNSSTTSTSTALNDSVVTVTVTVQVLASSTTTLPTVTQTLSPEEASSLLSSLLAQGGPATTATSDALDVPSQTLSSTVSATATGSDNLPTATPDSNSPTSATNIPSSSASPDASGTPVDIANTTASPTGLGSASGGYSGY